MPERGWNFDGHLGDQTWILVDISWILGGPWEQLWNHVDDLSVIWTTQLQCGLVFLVIWEWTWHQDAMPGSVENIISTTVFVRFAVLEKLEF